MKPKIIIPCVCIDHKPTVDDSVFYGMPQLTVYQDRLGNQRYSAFCPKCGRGTKYGDHKSAHKALRDWNECAKSCWFITVDREKAPKWKRDLQTKYCGQKIYVTPNGEKTQVTKKEESEKGNEIH